MATGEAAQSVFEVVYRDEWVVSAESVASGVHVLDCRGLFSDGRTSIWVEYFGTVASKVIPVTEEGSSSPPAATHMVPKPASQPNGFMMETERPFLVVRNASAGDFTVARTTPPK